MVTTYGPQVSLEEIVYATMEQYGRTHDELVHVAKNRSEVPTQIYVLFTDGTYLTLELTYPLNS